MTRWARGGNSNKKKVHEASSWEEVKQEYGKGALKAGMNRKKTNHDVCRDSQKQCRIGQTQNRTGSDVHLQGHKETFETEDHYKKKKTSIPTRGTKKGQDGLLPGHANKSIVDVIVEVDVGRHEEQQRHKDDADPKASEGNSNQACGSQELFEKREKRREERRLKRQRRKSEKMVCFHCRQPGHGVADCPRTIVDVEQGTGICFRCGSTEHDVSKCTAKVNPKEGEFPYAKCFICKQTGHLSSGCPDNPRGLYPEGGSCKYCGSVEHRWWNCPVSKPVKGVSVSVFMDMVHKGRHTSADAEPAFLKRPAVKAKKSGPKVVVF